MHTHTRAHLLVLVGVVGALLSLPLLRLGLVARPQHAPHLARRDRGGRSVHRLNALLHRLLLLLLLIARPEHRAGGCHEGGAAPRTGGVGGSRARAATSAVV